MIDSGEGRVTYFGFDKYKSGAKAADAYNARGQISHLNDQLRGLTTYHYDLKDRLAEAVTQPEQRSEIQPTLHSANKSVAHLITGLEVRSVTDLPTREAFAHHPGHAVLASADSVEHAQALANRAEVNHNRLLQSHRGVRYEYDALGRRVCEAPVLTLLNGLMERAGVDQPAIPQRKQYTYNAQGQLASVHIPDTETTVTFTYDPLGRRNSKTVTNSEEKPTTTRYLWDGDHLLAKWVEGSPAEAATFTSYIFEPGSFTPLAEVITPLGKEQKAAELDHELERAQVEGDSSVNPEHSFGCETQTRFYHTNHRSAPEEITNEQGELIWRGRYSAYGNVLIEEGKEPQLFRFAGQIADPETGLCYNRHRYYDAETASFISQDPIGLLGGLNPYRYAPNPVGWVDPLGLTAQKEATTRQVDAVSRVQTQTMPPVAPGTNSRPDFYVGPSGPESTLPSTGYRYMRYKHDDGSIDKYVDMTIENKSAPSTYVGFKKYDTGSEARNAFQIKGPEIGPDVTGDSSWSDARLRGEFDTLQLYKNGEVQARVPNWAGDTDKTKLEPFAEAYPEYGSGGAAQIHVEGRKIDFDNVDILPED